MYDYRKMSEEEKQKILEYRRKRGYPLHAPPHPYKDFQTYHLWASCVDHKQIFQKPRDLTMLQNNILDSMNEADITCIAWAFLPNHYHLLLQPEAFDELSESLRLTHSNISTTINSRHNQKGRKVWNRYAERGIRNSDHYWNVINYIHYNPVEHNYVDDVTEWPWSSVHDFIENYGREKMKRIWDCYPVQEYMKQRTVDD